MTITLTREEAQQLLEVFELFLEEAEDVTTLENNLVKMLRTRLAQPEPEPIAYKVGDATVYIKPPIYTAPPQREFIGLTDEERTYLAWESNNGPHCVAMTEAKLKEKNT